MRHIFGPAISITFLLFCGAALAQAITPRPEPMPSSAPEKTTGSKPPSILKSEYIFIPANSSCSIRIGDVLITSYPLLVSSRASRIVTQNTSAVHIHSCECALMGDPKNCILNEMMKAARPVQLTPSERIQLTGRTFIFVQDSIEFSNLYAALNSYYVSSPSEAPWNVMNAASVATQNAPAPPGVPPPPGGSLGTYEGGNQGDGGESRKKDDHCELEPSICINPASRKLSAEFELKCKGLPGFVFTTDGTAGIKVGPFKLSFEAADREEKSPRKEH